MCAFETAAGRVSSFAWKFIRIVARSKRLCRALIGTVINRFTPDELGIDLRLLTKPEDTVNITTEDSEAIETLSILVRANMEMLSGNKNIAKFAQQISEMLIQETLKKLDAEREAATSLVEFGNLEVDTADNEDEVFDEDEDVIGLSFAELEEENEIASPEGGKAEAAGDESGAKEVSATPTRPPVGQRVRGWINRLTERIRPRQRQMKAALMFTSMAFVIAVTGSVGGLGVIFSGILLSILLFFQGLLYSSDTREQSTAEVLPPSPTEEPVTPLSPPVMEQGTDGPTADTIDVDDRSSDS